MLPLKRYLGNGEGLRVTVGALVVGAMLGVGGLSPKTRVAKNESLGKRFKGQLGLACACEGRFRLQDTPRVSERWC